MLLQKAVIMDPYARSIVGRRQYGQLAQVRYLLFDRVAVLLAGGFWTTLIGKQVLFFHMQHAW